MNLNSNLANSGNFKKKVVFFKSQFWYKLLVFFVLLNYSCKTNQVNTPKTTDDGKIEFQFLQVNDVYEIAPLENGKIGGMARLATLNKKYKSENPNTLTILSGDFLSPTLIGTLKMDGRRINGKQMVDLMNRAGVDLVTFGNHEFDLNYPDLQLRLDESGFLWISSNVLQRNDTGELNRFFQIKNGEKSYVPDHFVWEIADRDGTKMKVGFFGLTLPTFPVPYVHYEDFYLEGRKAVQHLSRDCDVVIGVTHLERGQDSLLALQIQDVPLLMGGHEHENMLFKSGKTTVAKADANAKTAFIHRLSFDKKSKKIELKSELVQLDSTVALDAETTRYVENWQQILLDKIVEIVPNPSETIYHADPPLDALESHIRQKQTNFGAVVTEGIFRSSGQNTDGALMNAGGVRIDDYLRDDLTPVDIFRALPFGGKVLVVTLEGGFLKEVLDAGEASRGKGAYLQRYNFDYDAQNKTWKVAGKQIVENQHYRVAMIDFLMEGLDLPLLKKGVPGVIHIEYPQETDLNWDLRRAVIAFLKSKK